jgi:NTE family protein
MSLTPYAERRYFASASRKGVALCLSGGGFRAALFHLGAVRRLYELGILQHVRTIAAVSGGSLLAAHLARQWKQWGTSTLGPAEWNRTIVEPFRDVTSTHWNIWPNIKSLVNGSAGVLEVAARVERSVASGERLHDLPAPPAPQFKFCATDLVSGRPWVFDRDTPENYRVATAVAASSCVPIFLGPYTPATPERRAFVDGGVSDDRGVESVWRDHDTLLVSDGGDVLRPKWGRSLTWSWIRSATVVWNAHREIQKRWLLSSFEAGRIDGTYWGIESSPWHYPLKTLQTYQGYSPGLARDVISGIRTQYDAFARAEAAILENHGYLLADVAVRSHVPGLIRPPTQDLERVRIPNPGWMCEEDIRDLLAGASRRKPADR